MFLTYLIVFLLSILVGFINTLVGSGSLIVLPMLMALGLPANVANGTTRVAVVFQSFTGTVTFFKNKKIDLQAGWWAILPCVLGAIFGAWMATQINPKALNDFIGIFLIVMLVIILLDPQKWVKETAMSENRSKKITSILLMFVVGIYGGFIQAGIGIFLLASLVLGLKFSMSYANALKLLIVFAYAVPVLLVFVWDNEVNWFWGLFTSIGQIIGAYLGANFATKNKNANVWIYRLMVMVVSISIIHFYFFS